MKNFLMLLFVTAFTIIGCNNSAEKQTTVSTPPPPPAPAAPTPTDTAKPAEAPIVGSTSYSCYQLVEKSKDTYSCQIGTRATPNPFVSGYLDWSPNQKDGGHGVLKNGVIKDVMLTADWVYMIEGAVQTEEVYLKIDGDKLTKMRGELVDKKGKLVAKDLKKLKPEVVLAKVDCKVLDKITSNIKALEDKLK